MTVTLLEGDCLALLPTLRADSFDSCVTDPPYHLTAGKKGGSGLASVNPNSPAGRFMIGTGFMGKAWDGGDVAFRPETWVKVLRVLKPGAFMVAFASTRGYHRMVCAIEDAGFEIRDTIAWLYGTGFPKSRNLDGDWKGWGTALKPAMELICVARKPLDGTVAGNVLKHGVGAIHIDACRVPTDELQVTRDGEQTASRRYTKSGVTDFTPTPGKRYGKPFLVARHNEQSDLASNVYGKGLAGSLAAGETLLGRWPANLILSYPENEYILKPDVTDEQRRELYRFLHENS